jgi:hypothetical protein
MVPRPAEGIKKAGGPIWPSGSSASAFALRQVKKAQISRDGAPKGATIRSRVAAGLARKMLVICVDTTPELIWAR